MSTDQSCTVLVHNRICCEKYRISQVSIVGSVERVTAIIKNVKNRNFPKCQGIWEISQIPRLWEISQIIWNLRNLQNLKNIPASNTYRNLGNFPNAWISGKFPKCLAIWEISQMHEYLGNFPNAWVSEKFPKCLGI